MDITGHNPSDVYTTELRVSLNLSGQTGVTGCTAAGTSDINCGGGNPGTQYNRLLNLVAGHDYLMMINNWTNSTAGYRLVFSGTALLNDPNNPKPKVAGVNIVGCDASKLKVTFSEDILCSSFSPVNGTEFSVTAGTNTITGIVSDCSLGANSVQSVIINLQTALPAGNYDLNVGLGADNNTLQNVCKVDMDPVAVPFTVPSIVPAAVNNISYTGCAPKVLDIKFTKPVYCNSITTLGPNIELSIQPGNIPITSVQGVCTGANSIADLLHVNLQNPLPFGNYQLVVGNGADGNTFIDTCGSDVAVTSFPFTINQTTQPPQIQTFIYDDCHRDKLTVVFDKPVACGSVSNDYSEFKLLGLSNASVTSITSNCGSNNYATEFTFFFSGNLTPQSFNVAIFNGADGTTLSDTCYAFITQGYSKGFTATIPPPPAFESVQFDECDPTKVKVFFTHPIKCNTVFAGGWPQFNFVPVNGNYTGSIIAATTDPATCAQGYTKWIEFQLSAPVTTAGTYRLVAMNVGSPVIDTCDMPLPTLLPTAFIDFAMLGKLSATFTSQVKFACVMDTITFTHPGGNGINSWSWTFSDGSTASGQTVIKTFPVSTPTITAQLTVSNGVCTDVSNQTITLGNAFQAAFTITPKDTTCINTPVSFTNNSIGNNLNYAWDLGDNTQFNGQTPPPHTYTVSNTYNIKLTVTDAYGCKDVGGIILVVAPAASIDFTGLNPQYCTDKIISLTKVASPYISTYTWDNGNGITIKDKPNVQFSYPAQGNFTITLNATDKFCGNATATKSVDIFDVPNINLGNDTIICSASPFLVGPAPVNGYNYLWNTGAVTSQIFINNATATYSLQADNNGCVGSDAITVKVLSVCLIMVPNAFTPNNDGNNDRLRPTNADLAKEFSFKVFNRFGQLMYTSSNPTEGWDGMHKGIKAETGTYIWQLSYIDPWTGKKVFEKGTSILLR